MTIHTTRLTFCLTCISQILKANVHTLCDLLVLNTIPYSITFVYALAHGWLARWVDGWMAMLLLMLLLLFIMFTLFDKL